VTIYLRIATCGLTRTKGAERPTDRASTEGRLVPALFSAAYRR